MHEKEFYHNQLRSFYSLLPSGVELLIVSKNRSVEEIKAYYDLGHRNFGENKVQELEKKSSLLMDICPNISWHMIGHLQSNKVKQLLKISGLVAIHSVDNEKLLLNLLSYDEKIENRVGIFLQVNTSDEEEKSGFESTDDILRMVNHFQGKKNFFLQGLMTMGRIRTDDLKKEARICFKKLNEIKFICEKVSRTKLQTSMGMSQDFEIALEEGSNWIRLGTVMF